jgi:hypothetical protein
MIKAEDSLHLANRCDVCATPATLPNRQPRFFFTAQRRQQNILRPAHYRMRQACHPDAYQSFPDEAAHALYRSMDSCSNYST